MKTVRHAVWIIVFAVAVPALSDQSKPPGNDKKEHVRESPRPDKLIPPVPPAPQPEDPTPGQPKRSGAPLSDAQPADREGPQEQPAPVRPSGREIVVLGSTGDILTDGVPAPQATSGILMQAKTGAAPSIAAKLGPWSTVTPSFTVFSHADEALLSVRADGVAELSRAQDGGTVMSIRNASSASFSYAGLHFFGSPTEGPRMSINSIGPGYLGATGGPNALQFWNFRPAPIVFATASTERLRIHPNGRITVGAQTEHARLTVFDRDDNANAVYVAKAAEIDQNVYQVDTGLVVSADAIIPAGVVNTGDLVGSRIESFLSGTGTVGRTIGEIVTAGVLFDAGRTVQGIVTTAIGSQIRIIGGSNVNTGLGLVIDDIGATTGYSVWQAGADDTNYFAGALAIGIDTAEAGTKLHLAGNAKLDGVVTVGPTIAAGQPVPATTYLTVNGSLDVKGNVAAKYQDLAEWVPAIGAPEPGSVVILAANAVNTVTASDKPYDTRVAGVVSAQPGVILGESGPTKVMVATTGRVKVKVDATAGAIEVGDLLVTSSRPGLAMKSQPVDLGGIALHRPGTLVGKALEPLPGGVGEILVLLSLQ